MKPMIKRIIERALPITILRSLPNGVCDQIINNQVLRNTKEYVLQSGDIEGIDDLNNIARVYTKVLTGISPASSEGVIQGKTLVLNWPEVAWVNRDNVTSIGHTTTYTGEGRLYFIVAKGTYANLAAARVALVDTKISYQLSTPVYESYNGFPPSM